MLHAQFAQAHVNVTFAKFAFPRVHCLPACHKSIHLGLSSAYILLCFPLHTQAISHMCPQLLDKARVLEFVRDVATRVGVFLPYLEGTDIRFVQCDTAAKIREISGSHSYANAEETAKDRLLHSAGLLDIVMHSFRSYADIAVSQMTTLKNPALFAALLSGRVIPSVGDQAAHVAKADSTGGWAEPQVRATLLHAVAPGG